MNLIRISESDDFIVDYDKDKGMYRVSIFEDYHFKDEIWFDAYEEKEIRTKDIALPIKRFKNYNHEWWTGYCPRCDVLVSYTYNRCLCGERKQYCFKCGQLCDFQDI